MNFDGQVHLLILKLISLQASPPNTFVLSSLHQSPKHVWKETESILSFHHLQNSCLFSLAPSISSAVILISSNFYSTFQVWSVKKNKKKTLFVFPLDSSTGARVSWLEMDQCVSSALRWKHYEPLWSLGKHTRAHMHKCAHIITHSMFLYIAKTIFKGGSIILWHLTNWIMGKWSLGFLTGRHCAISILMTFRRS